MSLAVATDGALVEEHDVPGEGAFLVKEDVLHLAQFLLQGGIGHGAGVCLFV